MGILDRIKSGWNAFMGRHPTTKDIGTGYRRRPDRARVSKYGEQSTMNGICNRIAIDCAKITMKHARRNEEGYFIDNIDSTLNDCLTVEANLDQTGRNFRHDAFMSMLDEGVVALLPVDTAEDPYTGTFKILSMRTAKILSWYPNHVRVRAYDERDGKHKELVVPKRLVAIVENPLYAVMNEPNSTLQRYLRKLQLLDDYDERVASGKLNIIIGLPYVVKTEARKLQAEKRRAEIEAQLTQSKYGIAYTDGTENITQLNRALENNLLEQIDKLKAEVYGQLGLTKDIFEGNATEETLLNYYDRTIEPIISAFADEMNRKFLSKTARSQGQAIMFFRDPFRLIPLKTLADVVMSLKQAEVVTSNECREVMGYKPDPNKESDQLRNPNINTHQDSPQDDEGYDEDYDEGYYEDQQ